MNLIQKVLLVLIATLPLVSPIRIDLGYINVSPESLKLGVGIVVSMVLIVWWMVNQYRFDKIKIIETPLYVPLFGFITWCFVTLLWVEDWNLAIVMLAQYVSFVLIFLLVLNVFNSFENGRKILKILIYSMAVVSIIGLLQYYFYDNEIIQNLFVQTAKPGATFSNKNMASHFIVMTLPLSIVFIFLSQQKIKIYKYGLITFIGVWFLIYTSARQAYVAVMIEAFVLVVFFILDSWKNKRLGFLRKTAELKTKSLVILLVLLSSSFVANFDFQEWDFSKGSKFEKVQSINANGGSNRFPAWLNTIEMIKENPIHGVGIGQWQAKYPLYYDRIKNDVIFNEEVRLQRLHNEYLEVFANFGAVGYAFLLWILVLVIRYLWLVLLDFNHKYRIEFLGLSLGMIGFSTVAMFSFPVRVYLPGFLLMIFFALTVLGSREKSLKNIEIVNNKTVLKILIAFLFLLTYFISLNSYKWVMAEKHYMIARALEFLGENKLAAGAGMESLSLNRYSPDYYSIVGRNLFNSGQAKEAVFFLKKSIDISPFDTGGLLNMALTYRVLKNFSMERKILDLIIRIDPKNVRASAQLVRILVEGGQNKDAIIVYQNLKNNFIHFMNRSNFGPYNNVVGEVSMSVGDYIFSEFVYQDALDKNNLAVDYVKLATVKFYNLNKQLEAVKLYKKALELDPEMLKNKEIRNLIDEYESGVKQHSLKYNL